MVVTVATPAVTLFQLGPLFQEDIVRRLKEMRDFEPIIAKNWRSTVCQQVACVARDHLAAT